MKKLFITLLLALCAGCAGNMVHDDHVMPTSLPQAGQEAQKLIDEIRAQSITAKLTLNDDLGQGVLTPDEVQSYLDELKELRKQLDDAQAAIKSGNYASALSQANVTKTLLTLMVKEAAAAAAKRSPPKKTSEVWYDLPIPAGA